jgi:hypothetical protein
VDSDLVTKARRSSVAQCAIASGAAIYRRRPRKGEANGRRDRDRSQRAPERSGLRRVPRLRWLVVPPPPVCAVWPCWVLRLLAVPACESTRHRDGACHRSELRTGRRLVLGLLNRGSPRRSCPGCAAPSPARPAGARTGRASAQRLGATLALGTSLAAHLVCRREDSSR